MANSGKAGNKDTQNLASTKITTITLADGNEYELAPVTINLMAEVEEKFDLPFFEIIQKRRVFHIRYIMYLRLRNKYPNLTEEKVGELVTSETLMEIAKIYGVG